MKPQGLLKQIQSMQERAERVRKELAIAEYAGGIPEMVNITVTGSGEIKSLTISAEAMKEDPDTLADMIVVASRKAHELKEAAAKEKFASIAAGLLPIGMKFPGL